MAATVLGVDRMRPRHFELLSDQAVEAYADLINKSWRSGRWPRQMSLVILAMIPKSDGNFRPVGLLPMPYRLLMNI